MISSSKKQAIDEIMNGDPEMGDIRGYGLEKTAQKIYTGDNDEGDPEFGDPVEEGDVLKALGYGEPSEEGDLFGGEPINQDQEGEPFSGDPAQGVVGAIKRKANSMPGKQRKRFMEKIKARASTPDGIGASTNFAPVTNWNANIVTPPTKTLMRGQGVSYQFQAYMLTQPLDSVSQTGTTVAGTPLVLTFNTALGGTQATQAFLIVLEVSGSDNNLTPGVLATVNFTGVIVGSGVAFNQTWGVRWHTQRKGVATLCLIPYIERNNELFPQLLQANATNNLVITVAGLGGGYNVTATVLTPNDFRFYGFMDQFGFRNQGRIKLPN